MTVCSAHVKCFVICCWAVDSVIQWVGVWLSVINHHRHNTAAWPTLLWCQLPDLYRENPRSTLQWRSEVLRRNACHACRRNSGVGRCGIDSSRGQYVTGSSTFQASSDSEPSGSVSAENRAYKIGAATFATVEAGTITTRTRDISFCETRAASNTKVSSCVNDVDGSSSCTGLPTVSVPSCHCFLQFWHLRDLLW